jgi:hypothetical protein
MVSDNTSNVVDAFDVLLEEIEAQIGLTDKIGAHAFEQHDYDQTRRVLEQAGQLATFRDKVMALRLDWEETFGSPADTPTERDGEPRAVPSGQAFRSACLARVEKQIKAKLVKKSAASYAVADGKVALVCAVSKEYLRTGQPRYWFAFHTNQAQFLEPAVQGYLALGCGTPDRTLLIPFAELRQWLETLNTTERNDGLYWHIHVWRRGDRLTLDRKKGYAVVDLTQYLLR